MLSTQIQNLHLKKTHSCDSNPEESSITKIIKHIAFGYSLFTLCLIPQKT